MKKILAAVSALLIVLSLAACSGSDGTATTAKSETPSESILKTTKSQEEIEQNNRKVLARIGFEELMNYINMCEAYGVEIPIENGETVGEIIAHFEDEGGSFSLNNVKTDAVFFDFAKENPDFENGTGKYVIREDADWLSIYTD